MRFRNLIGVIRDARWLTRERIIAGGQVLLLIELTILVLLALWQHGVIADSPAKTSSDFVSFYAAGKLALAGTPVLAYDQAAHFLTEQQFTVPGSQYQFFFYPPVFMLMFAPLALLPYFVAFYIFEITTLVAFVLTMRLVLREPGWAWLGPVLAFPAIFWTLGLGQNAFLTAALFGGFTLQIDRRPVLAGVLLGLACYKPHFGLLAPAALACGGHWRAFFSAGVTVASLVALSVAAFGIETWQAWFTAFAGSDALYASGRIDYAGMITPFGAARLLGFNPSASYLAQAFITGSMALLVAMIWRLGPNRNLRAATLLSATLLAVPMALLYDKLLLLVAIGWLVRDGRTHGFLPWEKTVLLAAYLASLVTWLVGSAWHVPLGPIISFAVLLLTLRRIERAMVVRRRTGAIATPVSGMSDLPASARP
jgi:alpha-1,2-mannosyltransferase